MPNTAGIDRIAAATNALRPDWSIASIRTLITNDPALASRGFQDLALALTHVATDPRSVTPGRVRETGPWWRIGLPADGDRTQLQHRQARCDVAPHHRHEPAGNCSVCRSDALTATHTLTTTGDTP